jgi:mycothiol synthase
MRVTQYDEATAAALGRIVAACHDGDGREPLDEAARLHLAHQGLHAAALWLADAGFALLRRHAGGHGADHASGPAERYALALAVSPAGRRRGAGRALLEAALAETGAGPVTAWSHGGHPGAAALAAAHRFRAVRELLVLRRPLTEAMQPTGGSGSAVRLLADAAAASVSVAGSPDADRPRIRSWREGDTEELLRVNAAAFAHHPEQGGMDAANLAERMAEPWFDPAGLLIAADADGRLLGFHWTKVHPGRHGEVYVVAVDPSSHGRGVGSALLRAGLDHLAHVGCTDVHLYVEADNAPALALYRRLGFTTDHVHVQYARP